ncbi:MAG: ABC transporter permease subunit [Pseudomonadota bacterium]
MSDVVGWLDEYAWGAWVILRVFCVAAVLTLVFGVIGASARLAGGWPSRIAGAYVTFFRGTPELLVLLLFYFGSAVTLTAIARWIDPDAGFLDIPPFWAGSLAIALIAGAYATESFRGAFLGVERGQLDAARSLGMRPWAVLLFVRLPQAWRIALPSFGNHLISLMKDTALVSVIGLNEIMFTAKMATSVTQAPFTMFAVVAVIYLAFTSALTAGLRALEARANRHLLR